MPVPTASASIVPQDSVGGRALVAVVAIMTFLASLTTGAVMLVRASAVEWQSDVARELTIQVRPVPGREMEADLARASDIARRFSGIADVRPYTREESERLLEPWLGTGLSLEQLPVPRLIVLRLTDGADVDLPRLRTALAEAVPGASLDDHRGWVDRMRSMSDTVVIVGALILVLMLAAMVLCVAFATRGAMASNRPIVEVLHFIGAKDGYIASQFQRHFLVLGLKGGLIGGGAAILLFAAGGFAVNRFMATAGGDQLTALFGTLSIGIEGYILILLQIALAAALTAVTSRHTVNQTLDAV
ncbi:MAG: ABC transporter permease [Pseudorhodoplanes sp.]|nr:ABC transporter permease [Pseudorhodoplanes sp.]